MIRAPKGSSLLVAVILAGALFAALIAGLTPARTVPVQGAALNVDDIPVARKSTPGSDVPIGTPLLVEGFETGVFPPAGWHDFAYTSIDAPDYGWHQRDTDPSPHSGTYSAYHGDIAGGAGAESWLITPQLTPTLGSTVIFWQYEAFPTFYGRHSIWVSAGDIDPKENDYELVAEMGAGAEHAWEQVSVDLSDYAGQTVYVAFRYESLDRGTGADRWAVDDIEITAPLRATNSSPTALGYATWLTPVLGTGTNVTYTWDFGDGSPATPAETVSHTYAVPGRYTAVVTGSNSSSTATATTTIIVDESLSGLAASNNGPTALGTATTLDASPAAGTNVTYSWNFGDGSTGTDAPTTHTYSAIGTYTATVTATNSVGQLSATTVVTVDESITGLTASATTPVATGDIVTLTAATDAGTHMTFSWNLDDGSPAKMGQVITHTYAAGTYPATVTAANSVGQAQAETVVIVDTPIAGLNAANNGPTALGAETMLTAEAAAGSSIAYTWDLGDGNTANGNVAQVTYPTIGIYTATVTAANSISTLTETTVITVDERIAGLEATANGPVSLGQSVGLTATLTDGSNVTYVWDLGDGTSTSGSQTTHTYAAPGTYTAIVTATNSVGQETDTVAIVVDEAITGLTASHDGPTSLGTDTTFVTSIISGTAIVYTWNFGDGNSGTGATPTHHYTTMGTYTATVTATNSISRLSHATIVTVDETIGGSDIIQNGSVVQDQQSVFTATWLTGSRVRTTWDFGDGAVASGTVVTHTYTAPGTYTVTLTATNAVGAEIVQRTTSILAPIAGLDASSDTPTTHGNPTTLTATITAGTDVTYAWDFGDGTTSNGATTSHTYATPGTYTATVVAQDPAHALTATTAVLVEEAIDALYVEHDGPTVLGSVTTVTATVLSGSNVSFSWDFGNGTLGTRTTLVPPAYGRLGLPAPQSIVISTTYPSPEVYTIVVTATNAVGTKVATEYVIVDEVIAGPLLDEDFSSSFPPADWQTGTSGQESIDWVRTEDLSHSAPAAVQHRDAHGDQDSWLITPRITPALSSRLTFWQHQDFAGYYEYHGVWVSTGSPDPKDGDFVEFIELGPGAEDTWEQLNLDLGVFAGQPIYLAFRYQGDFADVWTLDDVRVTVDLEAGNNGPTALNATTAFTASVATGTRIAYTWDFGDGTAPQPATTSPSSFHDYAAVGTYTATVTATNNVSSRTQTTRVIVDEVIEGLDITHNGPVVQGLTSVFTASWASGSRVTPCWDLGDGTTAEGLVITHTFATPGTYTVTLTAANSVGTTSTTDLAFINTPVSGLTAGNDGPTPLTTPTTFTTTIATGTDVAYAWSFGDGTTGNGATAAHTYTLPGTYTATVSASDALWSVTTSTVVDVDETIDGMDITQNGPLVQGLTSVFTATTSAGSRVVSTWDFGDGITTAGTVVSHTYAAPGTYTVTLTGTNTVGQDQVVMPIVILEPVAGLSASSDSPTSLGDPTTLQAEVSVGTDVVYTWDFGDGTLGSGATTTHTYTAAGTYTAVITARDPVRAISTTTTVVVEEAIDVLLVSSDAPTVLGNVTTLTATIRSGTNVDFAWDFGNGDHGSRTTVVPAGLRRLGLPASQSVVVSTTYDTPGTYAAVATATNAVGTMTKAFTVHVDIPIASPLLTAGFETGQPPTPWEPSGGWWTYSSLAQGPQWITSTRRAHSGDSAIFHDDLHGEQDSWLISPRFGPEINSRLTFWQYENYADYYSYHAIWVSTGSGDPKDGDFALWAELAPGREDTWEQVDLDLSEFADRPIYLAFRYQGDFADEWTLDDITVSGDLRLTVENTVDLGDAATFTAFLPTGSNVAYIWNFGDGSPCVTTTRPTVSYAYPDPGHFMPTVTAINSVGQAITSAKTTVLAHSYMPIIRLGH